MTRPDPAGAPLRRRACLAALGGCLLCGGLFGARPARAQAASAPTGAEAIGDDWTLPPRHERPDVATDEGGLWALTDREERRVRRGSFIVRDDAWRDYATAVTCRLAGDHCPDARVYTVRTPQFNAQMAPNGMMQVWTGLLLRLENEAQLASVLGHEIGHYLQRHSVQRLRDAQSRSAFATLMAPFGLIGLAGQLAALGGLLAYSREHEREADRISLVLMRRCGYDTREAAKVWAQLRAELTAGAGGDPAQRSVFWATHPGIDERETLLRQWAGEGGGTTGEAEYQARLEPLLWDLLEDELRRAQYDETLALLDRHCARRPARADLRWFRGEARRLRNQAGDAEAALAEFEAAARLEKPPAQVNRSTGLVLRQMGRRDEARAAFERYLAGRPDAPDAALIKSYVAEMGS